MPCFILKTDDEAECPVANTQRIRQFFKVQALKIIKIQLAPNLLRAYVRSCSIAIFAVVTQRKHIYSAACAALIRYGIGSGAEWRKVEDQSPVCDKLALFIQKKNCEVPNLRNKSDERRNNGQRSGRRD
jgi:hypothetical protein